MADKRKTPAPRRRPHIMLDLDSNTGFELWLSLGLVLAIARGQTDAADLIPQLWPGPDHSTFKHHRETLERLWIALSRAMQQAAPGEWQKHPLLASGALSALGRTLDPAAPVVPPLAVPVLKVRW